MKLLNAILSKLSKLIKQYLKPVEDVEDKAQLSFVSFEEIKNSIVHDLNNGEGDEIISALKEINNDKFSKLIFILRKINKQLWDEYDAECEKLYNEEHAADIANSLILNELRNSNSGFKEIIWPMLNCFNEIQNYKFKAYNMDHETWNLLKLYTEDAIGNEDCCSYEFIVDPNLSKIKVPYCDCGDYEISDTFSISGNCIDSNCDTYATQLGISAESLYAFFIEDIGKYALVNKSYSVL